jgi:hypothetical protein
VTPYAVCTMHIETRSVCFLVEPQNQSRRFVSGSRVSWFEPQNWQLRFSDLGLKIITTISWFEPQNQADIDLSVASQN